MIDCILFELLLVGTPVGLAFFVGTHVFSSRYPNKIATCGQVTLLLGIAGFLVSIQLAFLALFANWYEGFAFSPLTWAPDGQYLAFGVEVDGFRSWSVFVMDADGKHRKKLVDFHEDEQFSLSYIDEIRWTTDSRQVLFMGTGGYTLTSRYYAIDPKEGSIVQISEDDYSSISSVTTDDEFAGDTPCNARHMIHDRAVYDNQLIAQSVCHGEQYGVTTAWHECYQELEICEGATGKVLLVMDDYPLKTEDGIRKEKRASLALTTTGLLTVVGFTVTIVTALYQLVLRA